MVFWPVKKKVIRRRFARNPQVPSPWTLNGVARGNFCIRIAESQRQLPFSAELAGRTHERVFIMSAFVIALMTAVRTGDGIRCVYRALTVSQILEQKHS